MDSTAAASLSPLLALLLESWVLVARALFIVAGVLVASNSAEIMLRSIHLKRAMRSGSPRAHLAFALNNLAEEPPYSPFNNALAWFIISCGGIVGATVFIYSGQITIGRQDNLISQLGVMAIWTGLATGVVCRAADRSKRPRNIWLAAAIFGGFGFALTVGEILL